jgi:hypothetical protein
MSDLLGYRHARCGSRVILCGKGCNCSVFGAKLADTHYKLGPTVKPYNIILLLVSPVTISNNNNKKLAGPKITRLLKVGYRTNKFWFCIKK